MCKAIEQLKLQMVNFEEKMIVFRKFPLHASPMVTRYFNKSTTILIKRCNEHRKTFAENNQNIIEMLIGTK